MAILIHPATLNEITLLRRLFLQENNFQIRYNACHERGWSDTYLVQYDGLNVGYGSIKGDENINDRNTVFEFYLLPSFRHLATAAFAQLLQVSKATYIQSQSNCLLLTSLLYQYCSFIQSEVILFGDGPTTTLNLPGALCRKRTVQDNVFEHTHEPVGEYVLLWNNDIVATGGFALHYNMPFADLYMEVKSTHRRKGFGSFLVQELKSASYLHGRVPAARCNKDNVASKGALVKGGMVEAGWVLRGRIG